MILHLLLSPFALLIAYRLQRLCKNYIAARSLGLPIILLPVSFEEPLWGALKPLFPWIESLPFGLGRWCFYTDMAHER